MFLFRFAAKLRNNYELCIMNYEIFCTFAEIICKTMKKTFFFLLLTAILLYACGNKHNQAMQETRAEAISLHENLPGDSAIYGLACDGCTDSVLVFLPYSGGDPDTFDIINARQENRIYGRPHIGDELAVILNPEDRDEALVVIDVEELKGTWCYMVEPTLRTPDKMHKRMQRRMMERIPDSVKQQMMTPREYSLRPKRDNTVQARGGMYRQTTTDDMSPVEYPSVKRYTDWHLYNGHLVLKADTMGIFSKEGDVPTVDTVEIVLLVKDSLVLRFPDHQQSYYRKTEKEE